jgi:tetratricopeptide (TPR) repeat protein
MPGEGDTLFVSFSPLNDKQEEPVIWGSPLFTKLNAPAIGFSSLGGDWYPWRDTVSLIPRISHIVARFSHIVVYGSSMGAYAAIKFSSLLNAGTVIALSPQWSITEADIGSFDDRFKTYVSPDLHDGMAIRSGDASGSVYVFVDPAHEADVQHIERISNVIACHIVPVRCVGHNTADFLANSGMSQPFFDAVHKREFDLRTARALIRKARRGSTYYLSNLSLYHSQRGQYPKAEAALRAAILVDATDIGLKLKLADHLIRRGRPDAARQELAGMTLDTIEQPGHGIQFAELQTTLGHAGEPIALSIAVVARWPDSLHARLRLANIMRGAGRHAEAMDHAAIAQTLDLSSANAWRGMAWCWHGLGQRDKAIAAISEAIAMNPADGELRLVLIEFLMDATRFRDAEAEALKARQLGLRGQPLQDRLDLIWRRLDFLRQIPELWGNPA